MHAVQADQEAAASSVLQGDLPAADSGADSEESSTTEAAGLLVHLQLDR